MKFMKMSKFLKLSSLRFIFGSLVALVVIFSNTSVGVTSYKMISKEKLLDTLAILYLDIEKKIDDVSSYFKSVESDIKISPLAVDVVVESLGGGQYKVLRGYLGKEVIKSEELEGVEADQSRHLIWKWAGDHYYVSFIDAEFRSQFNVETDSTLIGLKRIKLSEIFDNISSDYVVYIATKVGQLFYSNNSDINDINIIDRPVVREFVKSPVSRGQYDYKEDGEEYIGVFYEVADSNLVIFSESARSVALAAVYRLAPSFIMIFLVLIFSALAFAQWPLHYLVSPIESMSNMAGVVASGKYNSETRVKKKGIGEMAKLVNSFNDMVEKLIEKDHAIEKYIEEQKEAVRLSSELAIAQRIQTNFIPSSPISRESKVKLFAKYLPADECAGDWYSYHYDEAAGSVWIAVADVAGHGAGSAMFTAILAAGFTNFISNSRETPDDLLKSLNKQFMQLGKGEWHSTFVLAHISKNSSQVEFYGAGCTPVLHVFEDENGGGHEVKSHPFKSDVIGLFEDFTVEKVIFKKRAGDKFFLFSDGLTEAKLPNGKQFGIKKLKKAMTIHAPKNINAFAAGVLGDWEGKRDGVALDDDLCVVGIEVES